MGAEQSGDAEHKHAELNSSGMYDVFYVFFLTPLLWTIKLAYLLSIYVRAYIRIFPLTRAFIHERVYIGFCRVWFSLLWNEVLTCFGSVSLPLMLFIVCSGTISSEAEGEDGWYCCCGPGHTISEKYLQWSGCHKASRNTHFPAIVKRWASHNWKDFF